MRPGFLHTCLLSLYFLITSAASPRSQFRDMNEQLPPMIKGNMLALDLSKEPTCDELRAMWRFSKRQGRASETSNEIPTYRDPFAYNMWSDHASIRSVGGSKMRRPLVYGRLVHTVGYRPRTPEATPERIRAFEEVARLFGTPGYGSKVHHGRKPTVRLVGGREGLPVSMNQQVGSFQHLKEIIQAERARELHEQKVNEMSSGSANRQSLYPRPVQDYLRGSDREDRPPGYRSRNRVVGIPRVLSASKLNNGVYANLDYVRSHYPYMMDQPAAEPYMPEPAYV